MILLVFFKACEEELVATQAECKKAALEKFARSWHPGCSVIFILWKVRIYYVNVCFNPRFYKEVEWSGFFIEKQIQYNNFQTKISACVSSSARTCIYSRIFCRDLNNLKILEPPLFACNRLVLLRDMNFCISVPEKKKRWRHFHIKVLLSGELSLLKKRLCYKMSLMTVISQGLSEPSYFLIFHRLSVCIRKVYWLDLDGTQLTMTFPKQYSKYNVVVSQFLWHLPLKLVSCEGKQSSSQEKKKNQHCPHLTYYSNNQLALGIFCCLTCGKSVQWRKMLQLPEERNWGGLADTLKYPLILVGVAAPF